MLLYVLLIHTVMSAAVMSQISVMFCSTCVLAKDCGRGLAAVFWSDWAVLVIDSCDETQRGIINSIGMNFLFGAETALVF